MTIGALYGSQFTKHCVNLLEPHGVIGALLSRCSLSRGCTLFRSVASQLVGFQAIWAGTLLRNTRIIRIFKHFL